MGRVVGETFAALVQVGRTEGIPVLGHAPRNLHFSAVIENRQIGIAHAKELIYTRFTSLDTRDLDGVAASMAQAGTWLTPALSTFGNIASQWGTNEGLNARLNNDLARYVPDEMIKAWSDRNPCTPQDPRSRARIDAMFDFQHSLIRSFHRAGVPMLTGTDTPLPVLVPGFSLHDEIDALSNTGLSRYEALAAATRNSGQFVRQYVDDTAVFGTVTLGARADLLLLEEDPLADLAQLRHPLGVMLRGDGSRGRNWIKCSRRPPATSCPSWTAL